MTGTASSSVAAQMMANPIALQLARCRFRPHTPGTHFDLADCPSPGGVAGGVLAEVTGDPRLAPWADSAVDCRQ